MKFNNLKVGVRLGAGFAIVLALLAAITVLSLLSLRSIQAQLELVLQDRYHKVRLVTQVNDAQNDVSRYLRNVLIMTDTAQIADELKRVEPATRTVNAGMAELEQIMVTQRGKELIAAVKATREQYLVSARRFVNLVTSGEHAAARDLMLEELRPQQQTYTARLHDVVEYLNVTMDAAGNTAEQLTGRATLLILALALGAVVIGVLVAWWIARSIVVPIRDAVEVAETVAKGDLTAQVKATTTDECGQLMQALGRMNASLVDIVEQVRSGAEAISTASAEIATGNQDLSSRTEQQASALEETASSVEELTTTVRQNADNARQANSLARNASEVAERGSKVTLEVVDTMGEINDSSRRIVDIISVIDGIAFQTNILALNAAVEAARAGEQGRGFAVVATEVRNLAQRSAAAAKEIKDLIDDSVQKVENGTRLVDQAGATMQDILGSIQRVSDIVSEIAAASEEQSAGIVQINSAITQMDQVTQQNAALVEEAAAAAASMREQSRDLTQKVAYFRTGRQSGSAALGQGTPGVAARTPARVPAPARKSVTQRQPQLLPAQVPHGDPRDWEEF